ncbi:MAG: helix-turn-helix transcriptional regulator [Allopontixanthobacter sediminis]
MFEYELKDLGNNIRRAREARGFTQEAFAQEIGLDRAYYGRIERGLVNISARTVFMLAEALQIAPSRLFTIIVERTDEVQNRSEV